MPAYDTPLPVGLFPLLAAHVAEWPNNVSNSKSNQEECSMNRVTEIVTAIQHVLHVTKPLLFEAVLFIWAVVEMGKFIWTVALGGGS
jgi:hypothetical protein